MKKGPTSFFQLHTSVIVRVYYWQDSLPNDNCKKNNFIKSLVSSRHHLLLLFDESIQFQKKVDAIERHFQTASRGKMCL